MAKRRRQAWGQAALVLLACGIPAGYAGAATETKGRVVDAANVAAPSAPVADFDARRSIYLLEYVGSDYGAAVDDGQVIDQAEYGESIQITRRLLQEYETRFHRSDDVARALKALLASIEARASADAVKESTRRLLPSYSRAVGVSVLPGEEPSIASGARLWAENCATCHGATGGGDGPAAKGLDPQPAALNKRDVEWLSPRRVYGAVSYGIDGTGMVSFASTLSEKQR